MSKRLADSDIWNKDWFLDLTDKQKLLVKFLFDNCDCAGIYEISKRVLKVCFEQEITREDFEAIKQVRFINENTIFIEDFINFQYKVDIPNLNPKFTVHRGIIAKLNKYGIFETLSKGLPNPYQRVQDKDKDKDKDIYNTSNKQIDTINIDNINEKNSKKLISDPIYSPEMVYFLNTFKKECKQKVAISPAQRIKLMDILNDLIMNQGYNLEELTKNLCSNFNTIDFNLPSFTPSINWLLKDEAENFYSTLNGQNNKKKSDWEIYCEERGVDEYGN